MILLFGFKMTIQENIFQNEHSALVPLDGKRIV